MHSQPGVSPATVSLSWTGRNRWCLTGAVLRGLTEVLRRENAECGQTVRTAADPRTSRSQRLMRPTAGKTAGRYNRLHYSGSGNNPTAFSYRLFQKTFPWNIPKERTVQSRPGTGRTDAPSAPAGRSRTAWHRNRRSGIGDPLRILG